jgi:UTP--glucose-1-phosphate uridylyltransferase
MKRKKITKAVIAVAGYGTRFLPATKAQPKEMLPIIDKPIVQYLVEELVDSGITEIIMVTRFGQHMLEDHFDSNFELEYQLEKNGKTDRLEAIRRVTKMANFIYVRQGKHLPYGNGTPLLCVEHLIDENEDFVYVFGDDLVVSRVPCAKQLIDFWEAHHYPVGVVATQKVPKKEVVRYGIIKLKPGTKYEIERMIEKPDVDKAPSRLAQFGRFVLNAKIIRVLKKTPLGKDNELWLIDAIHEVARKERVLAAPIKGEWVTTGDPLRYIKAMVRFALKRKDIGRDFRGFLKEEIRL